MPQPIVDVDDRSIVAHEPLGRGPAGESPASVLAQVHAGNHYRFDQACRVIAEGIETAGERDFLHDAGVA